MPLDFAEDIRPRTSGIGQLYNYKFIEFKYITHSLQRNARYIGTVQQSGTHLSTFFKFFSFINHYF